jgi:hypothetical protein
MLAKNEPTHALTHMDNRVARWYTHFQTKQINLGKFWRVLQWKMLVYIFNGDLVYFMEIWYILWRFVIFYGDLVYFMDICYILWIFDIFYGHLVYFVNISFIYHLFGMLGLERSGNPDGQWQDMEHLANFRNVISVSCRVHILQGDQIGLFTLEYYFKNYRNRLNFWAALLKLFINFNKKRIGQHFGRFFYKLIWPPWYPHSHCSKETQKANHFMCNAILRGIFPVENFNVVQPTKSFLGSSRIRKICLREMGPHRFSLMLFVRFNSTVPQLTDNCRSK